MRRHLLLASLLLASCGSDDATPDDHDQTEEEDPAEHACVLGSDEGESITAGEQRGASAPEIELGHAPFTVALSEDAPSYLRIEASEDTPAVLFVSAADVVTGLYHEDDEEALDSAGPNPFCDDDIPEHFDLDLHEAGTYYLELAPSALSEVWIMLVEAEGHAH
jgi:hypothetical protein